jgi:biopolymer transport protein ExbB/TolQ
MIFGKITGKNNPVRKIIGIVLPVVFVGAVVASIALCMWNVRKKRRHHQKAELPHQSKTFNLYILA